MIDTLLLLIGGIGLLIGTITDFQKREVADWVNYAMLAAGLGIRAITAIATGDGEYFWLAAGVALLMYGIGSIMYYTGQWGGGDVKMLAAIGALTATTTLPVYDVLGGLNLPHNVSFMFHFIANLIITGAIYGVVWVFILYLRNIKKVNANTAPHIKKERTRIIIYSIVGVVILVGSVFIVEEIRWLGFLLGLLILLVPWMFIFVKTVEETCLIRKMKVQDLTEGEWIVNDLWVPKKNIETPLEYFMRRYNLPKKQTIAKIKGLCNVLIRSKSYEPVLVTESETEMLTIARHTRIRGRKFLHFLEQEGFKFDKEYICGPRDLGITNPQIERLKKLGIKNITVKIGIPFVPAFFISYLLTIFIGNFFLWVNL